MTSIETPISPENIMDMPWKEMKPGAWKEVQDLAERNKLKVSDNPQAIRGGRMFAIDPEFRKENQEFRSLAQYLSSEREIAIIPAKSEYAIENDRLIIIPSKEFPADKDFSANLAGFRVLEQYLAEKSGGRYSIPTLYNVMKLSEGRWAIVTEYRKGSEDFGLGDPRNGIYEMDSKKLVMGDMEKIFDACETVAVDSDYLFDKTGDFQEIWTPKKEFSDWLERQSWYRELGGKFPQGWFDWKNATRVFRGQEWWEGRVAEMTNIIKSNSNEKIRDDIRTLFQEVEREGGDGFNFEDAIIKMIENNKKLFPHQDGKITDKDEVGKTYVAHGTVYAGQVHKKTNSEGIAEIWLSGGDRGHYGSFAEYFAWQISALVGSPENQATFLNEYDKRYGRGTNSPDGKKKMRELKLFTAYRVIADVPRFIEKAYSDEKQRDKYFAKARSFIKFANEILEGKGFWEGID